MNQPELIEIRQNIPGFNQFIGAWIHSDEINVVVDVGPANSAPGLIASLSALGIERLDYVFLTHIHLDHSGALADLLAHYPEARAICHERSINHLVDPSKLWEGSRAVLGSVADGYGHPRPVPREKLIPHTESDLETLEVIETPGHAPHHLCFNYKGMLFAGEAGGSYFNMEGAEYLRPATPPRFFFEVSVQSIDRLLALEDQPIYYAHFGAGESSHGLLRRFRDQLMMWREIIGERFTEGSGDLVGGALTRLLKEDPNLRAFEKMGRERREREVIFLKSSIRGFLGCFEEKKKSA